jgi:hypothetical protein
LKEVVRMGRGVPRRFKRDFDEHPETVLATVGGASFVLGMVFGSRIGRAVLSALVPFGVQYVIESELGPRVLSYLQELMGQPGDSRKVS